MDTSNCLETLGAADVSVVAFVNGMAGISVPSRVYNVMCAGRPIIVVADRRSEVAELVAEHGLGWIVEPGDVRALVRAVEAAASDPYAVVAAGARARAVAEKFYTRGAVVAQYVSLANTLCGPEDRGRMRIAVVTGSTGFIGGHVCRALLDCGWTVRALVRAGRHAPAGSAEVQWDDFRDEPMLRHACDGADVLVHAAGVAHVFHASSRDRHHTTLAVREARPWRRPPRQRLV